jgi:hypothetical protein
MQWYTAAAPSTPLIRANLMPKNSTNHLGKSITLNLSLYYLLGFA